MNSQDESNPMTGSPAPDQGNGLGAPSGMADSMQGHHDQVQAQFNAFTKAQRALDSTRSTLDKLMKLGNSVTVDDVIEAAGKHVAGGHLSAVQMASLLSTMPSQDGPALAAWVLQKDQAVSQIEASFGPMMETARHALGTSALRMLQAGHLDTAMGTTAATPPPPGTEGSSPLMAMPPQGNA